MLAGTYRYKEHTLSQFEYVIVLAGVVVAVAMTEIVGTWGRILRTNARVTVDPIFVSWTCYLLLE